MLALSAVNAQAPPSQPTSLPTQTVASLIAQLESTPPNSRSLSDRALLAGLQFSRAVAAADAEAAASLLDSVGYQPLPLEGPLADPPPRPLRPGRFSTLVHARPRATLDQLPASMFELARRADVHGRFPAVGHWMLAQDVALIIQPRQADAPNWVRRECCLVIRIRMGRAQIVGGSLFDALP